MIEASPPTNDNRSPRVCFVSHDSNLYGAPRSLLEIVAFSQLPYDKVIFISPEPKNPLIEDILTGRNVDIYWVSKGVTGERCLTVRRLINRVRLLFVYIFIFWRNRIDLVYLNTIRNATAAVAAKILQLPVVWCIREMNDVLNHAGGQLRIKAMKKLSNRVIAITNAGANDLVARGLDRSKICVIPNGFTVPATDEVDKMIQKRLASKVKIVSYIGALESNKDIGTLIEAFSQIQLNWSNVFLWIFGDHLNYNISYKIDLVRQIEELNLSQRITFHGRVADVKPYLELIHINVLCSRMESFPRSLSEAMSYGIPCVSTDVGGIPEIIQHGINGFLTSVGDAEKIAHFVDVLLRDQVTYVAMAKNSHELFKRKYDIRWTARQHEEVICSVFAERESNSL